MPSSPGLIVLLSIRCLIWFGNSLVQAVLTQALHDPFKQASCLLLSNDCRMLTLWVMNGALMPGASLGEPCL